MRLSDRPDGHNGATSTDDSIVSAETHGDADDMKEGSCIWCLGCADRGSAGSV